MKLLVVCLILLLEWTDFGSCASQRIIGGREISITEAPYQVSVELYGVIHICGGALISRTFVLTAASCE